VKALVVVCVLAFARLVAAGPTDGLRAEVDAFGAEVDAYAKLSLATAQERSTAKAKRQDIYIRHARVHGRIEALLRQTEPPAARGRELTAQIARATEESRKGTAEDRRNAGIRVVTLRAELREHEAAVERWQAMQDPPLAALVRAAANDLDAHRERMLVLTGKRKP